MFSFLTQVLIRKLAKKVTNNLHISSLKFNLYIMLQRRKEDFVSFIMTTPNPTTRTF